MGIVYYIARRDFRILLMWKGELNLPNVCSLISASVHYSRKSFRLAKIRDWREFRIFSHSTRILIFHKASLLYLHYVDNVFIFFSNFSSGVLLIGFLHDTFLSTIKLGCNHCSNSFFLNVKRLIFRLQSLPVGGLTQALQFSTFWVCRNGFLVYSGSETFLLLESPRFPLDEN